MKENNDSGSDEKLPDIGKSLFETAREAEKHQAEEATKREITLRKYEEKQREEYAKQLRQERIELIRKKQGLADEESEPVENESVEKRQYTFGQKLSNFFYLNKWWLGVAVCFTGICGFLIYDLATKVNPDLTVMLISHSNLGNYSEELADLFEQCTEDINKDGKVYVQVMYLPASEEFDSTANYNYKISVATQRNGELQSGTTALIISDDAADEITGINAALDDFSNENVTAADNRFYLKDTKFAELLGYTGDIPDSLYIGIRCPQPKSPFADQLSETIEESRPTLYNLIELIKK